MSNYPYSPNPYPQQPNPQYNPTSQQIPPEKPVMKLFWILGIIFILLIVGIVSLFLFFSGDRDNKNETNFIPNQTNNVTNTSAFSLVIPCENIGCFISISQTCNKTNLTLTSMVDFLGINITTTQYYESFGREGNRCVLKFKLLEQHIVYSDELKQQMMNDGATQTEIEQQEQLGNEQADLIEGREGICKFSEANLIIFLNKWFGGNFSGSISCSAEGSENWSCSYSGDWELVNASCEGEYFSQEL